MHTGDRKNESVKIVLDEKDFRWILNHVHECSREDWFSPNAFIDGLIAGYKDGMKIINANKKNKRDRLGT